MPLRGSGNSDKSDRSGKEEVGEEKKR